MNNYFKVCALRHSESNRNGTCLLIKTEIRLDYCGAEDLHWPGPVGHRHLVTIELEILSAELISCDSGRLMAAEQYFSQAKIQIQDTLMLMSDLG